MHRLFQRRYEVTADLTCKTLAVLTQGNFDMTQEAR